MVLRVSLQEIKLFILRIMDTLLKMTKRAQIWKLMKLNLKYITYHYLFLLLIAIVILIARFNDDYYSLWYECVTNKLVMKIETN